MQPKFSIITVCYNEQSTIGQTCDSVVGQTFDDYEWIVIDGASTDRTPDILAEYSYRMVEFVSEPDGGIFHAMNKGASLAKGEYLVFMNGGDLFASNQVLEWVAESPSANIIYGNAHLDQVGGQCQMYPDQLPRGYQLNKQLTHQAMFYKRSLFSDYDPYDTSYRIAADYDLNVRLLEIEGISHYHINKPLAVFKLNGISNCPKNRKLRKRENHSVRMKYFPSYRWSPKAWRQMIRNKFMS